MEAFFNWVGNTANILGVLSATFALFAWLEASKINRKQKLEQERLNKEVKITLKSDNGDYFSLPVDMRRKELTRAELLGYIGMLPTKDNSRFRINYLSTQLFFQDLSKAQLANSNYEISIPCTQQEYDQFDFDALIGTSKENSNGS